MVAQPAEQEGAQEWDRDPGRTEENCYSDSLNHFDHWPLVADSDLVELAELVEPAPLAAVAALKELKPAVFESVLVPELVVFPAPLEL